MNTHARVFYTTTQEVSQATLIVGPTVVEHRQLLRRAQDVHAVRQMSLGLQRHFDI